MEGIDAPGQRRIALEAYPGYTARKITRHSYKSDDPGKHTQERRDARRTIVNGLLDIGLASGLNVGLGVSRGVVTGPVRILRALDPEALRPGEILVARATDPGWTPLFHRAGGLVTELGGMLSHGAVVARELGLPAVVNLPGATRLLRDGVVVTVDGGRGIVYLR
jgi:phosphoenolpyruvate synthase/pyruvate phosphate dikinase